MDKIEIRTLDEVEPTGFFDFQVRSSKALPRLPPCERAATETHPTAGR
jgi:hypothetical protein